MRALFTTQVVEGHWRPLVPFAHALQRAGHEVAFATTPFACGVIAGHGLCCFPAGVDDWRIPVPRTTRQAARPAGPAQAATVWADVFVGVRAARTLPDLLAIGATWRPDLLVREMTEFGGCVAAECLGIPHAAIQVGPYRPDLERSIAPALDGLRTAVGLPPDLERAMLYRHLLLTPVPPGFQDPDRPLPAARTVRWVGYDVAGPGTEEMIPDWLDQPPARPTVYATLGTAYNRTPGLFAAILAGLRDEPLNLIATLGPELDPALFGPLPPHVHLARFLP